MSSRNSVEKSVYISMCLNMELDSYTMCKGEKKECNSMAGHVAHNRGPERLRQESDMQPYWYTY